MTNLLHFPKDLLIKLILTVENNIKTSLQSLYQKGYDRQEKIYDGIRSVLREEWWIDIYRCNFPGCREVEIDSASCVVGNLNTCIFEKSDGTIKLYYCNAHDKLNYMKGIEYDEIFPVCDRCKIDELKRGSVLTEKNFKCVDKEKVRKQLEEDKMREDKEKNKVPIYYALSKDQLIETLFNIGTKTKEWYEQEHNKELLVIEYIMQKIKELYQGYFKIHNCKFKGCENLKIDGISGSEYYYNDVRGKICTECDNIYYCTDHLSHFPLTIKSRKGNKYLCRNCKREKKEFSIISE